MGLERPVLDLVSQTPRPRGRGRPLFAGQMMAMSLLEVPKRFFFARGGKFQIGGRARTSCNHAFCVSRAGAPC